MKKYNKPMIEIVAFQSKNNIAAVNPLYTISQDKGVKTTVYNLSLLADASLQDASDITDPESEE